MNCPHCSSPLLAGQPACQACGFSATAIRSYLGADWVRLERITDNAQRLSLRDTRHLETVLDDFERHFPQCFMAAYIGALPETLTLPDLGFWLINHGAFQTHQITRRNDFGLVLIIDTLRQEACMTVGYALENLISAQALTAILKKLRRPLLKGAVAKAIEEAAHRVESVLKASATRETRLAEQPPVIMGDAADLGLHSLRASPRPPSRPLLYADRPK